MNPSQYYQYDDMSKRSSDIYAITKYKIILNFLKTKKNLEILNVGCGSGELSFLLAELGHSVTSFDPSEVYINLAKKKLTSNYTHLCKFYVGSVENFYTNQKYDCIIATDVLEHIENDGHAIKKLTSFIKDDGYLIITVPAIPSLFGFHDEQLQHYRRYSKKSLKRVLPTTNWNMISIRYFGFTLIPVCLWFSKIRRCPYPISQKESSFLTRLILKFIMFLESILPCFLGTSILAFMHKVKN